MGSSMLRNAIWISFFLVYALVFTSPILAGNQERSLTLSKAVEIALANNLHLRLQRQEVERNQAAVLFEKGKFDTILTGKLLNGNQELSPVVEGDPEEEYSVGWLLRLQKTMTTGTQFALDWQNSFYETYSAVAPLDPLYSSDVTLSLRQPLINGFGVAAQTANLRAASRQAEAETFLVDSRAADLAAEVKKAYWELVFAYQDIGVKRLSFELAEKLLHETREKITAGVMASVDIHEPESEVALRERQHILSERAIGTAEDELKLLLNNSNWEERLETTDIPLLSNQLPELEQVIENALSTRPDIKASDLQVKAARITMAGMKNRTLVSVDFDGAIGISGSNDSYDGSVDDIFNKGDTMWRVGLVLSAPLHNQHAEGNYRQAMAKLRQAQTRAELLRQQVRRSAREAVRDVHLAVKGVEAAAKTTLASSKRLDAEQDKFHVGLATTNTVLEAQTAYAEALSSEYRLRVEYSMAVAELDRVQGMITLDRGDARNSTKGKADDYAMVQGVIGQY